jgi:hypothetical protein
MSKENEEVIIEIKDGGHIVVEYNNFKNKSCEVEDGRIRVLLSALGIKSEVIRSDFKVVKEAQPVSENNRAKLTN